MIVLTVLKWIGLILLWTILGILALALLLLIVVLFVPFRYEVRVAGGYNPAAWDNSSGKKVMYGFRLSWLARGITIKKKIDSEPIVLKILGIPIKKMGGATSKKSSKPEAESLDGVDDEWTRETSEEAGEEEAREMSEAEIDEIAGDDADRDETELDETDRDEAEGEKGSEAVHSETDESGGAKQKEGSQDADRGKATRVEYGRIDDPDEKKLSFFERLSKKINDKISDIKRKIRNKFKKIDFIFYKISSIIKFVRHETTGRAIRKVMKEVVKAIRYVGPRKMKGTVVFGTGDPSTTGMLIGGVSLFKAATNNDVMFTPNFDESCFAGDIYVRGRIRVIYFVRMAARLWFNKDIHDVWKRYRKMQKSFKANAS